MKRFIFTVIFSCILINSAVAQDTVPAYRAKGYKGNVSYINRYLLWNGVETSHGYMFNERYYVGGGIGFGAMAWGDKAIITGSIFAEGEAYWLPRNNTPTTAVRLNYIRNFSGSTHNIFADVTVGWSWGVGSHYGISANAGVSIPVFSGTSWVLSDILLIPILSVSFDF